MSPAAPPRPVTAVARATATATPAPVPAQNSALTLARSLSQLSEPALADALRGMSVAALRRLYGLVGVSYCSCPVAKVDCGCAGPCDCPAIVEPCPHADAAPLFAWPPAVEAEVLARIFPELFAEPPTPAAPTIVLLRRALTELRAERHAAGASIWHPADWIQAPRSTLLDQVTSRMARQVTRRRNGTDRVGRLTLAGPWLATTPPMPDRPSPIGWGALYRAPFAAVHQARLDHAGQLPAHRKPRGPDAPPAARSRRRRRPEAIP